MSMFMSIFQKNDHGHGTWTMMWTPKDIDADKDTDTEEWIPSVFKVKKYFEAKRSKTK
jgi:hypothetical protein